MPGRQAIAMARELKLTLKCELWQRGRMVATFDPTSRREGVPEGAR
ncbi:MAG: hypothetical protein ACJ8FN_01495 [Sphingomicrobium sp.]